MKRLLHSLLCLILITQVAKADHILGGDITYKHISELKYEVQVTIFRDCNECKLDGQGGGANTKDCGGFDLYLFSAESSTCDQKLLTTIELSKATYQSTLELCGSARSRCSSNPNFAYGIEAHYFKGEVDFAQYQAYKGCGMEFHVQMSLRKDDLTNVEGANRFFTYSYLDPWVQHSSPQFNPTPSLLLNCQKSFVENILASGTYSTDSISVTLDAPLKNRGDKLNYVSSYSVNRPLDVWCNGDAQCKPDFSANPVKGFYLDETSGQVGFTPMKCAEKAVVVYRVEKWLPDSTGVQQLVSVVRRDVQYTVSNISKNKTPTIREVVPQTWAICAGLSEKKHFTVNDPPTMGPNGPMASDTVRFEVIGAPNGFSYQVKSVNTAPYYELELTWAPNAQNVGKTSQVIIRVLDNSCPINEGTSYIINLEAKEAPESDWSIDYLGCGNLAFTNNNPAGKYHIQLVHRPTQAVQEVHNTVSDTFLFWRAGVYDIFAENLLDNGCGSQFVSNIDIKSEDLYMEYIDPEALKNETCENDTIRLQAKAVDQESYRYQWVVNDLVVREGEKWEIAAKDYDASTPIQLRLIREQNGIVCTDIEAVNITILPIPELLVWDELDVCYGAPNVDLMENVSPRTGTWELQNEAGKYEELQSNLFSTTDWQHKFFDRDYKLRYTVTDPESGCMAADKSVLHLRRLPQMQLKDIEMCTPGDRVLLKLFVERPFMYETGNYTWSSPNGSNTFVSDQYGDFWEFPENSTGRFELIGTNTTSFGCTNTDTAIFNFLEEAKIEINNPGVMCQQNEEIDLSGLLSVNLESGFWYSPSHSDLVSNGILSAEACGEVALTYTIDNLGCYDSKQIVLDIRCDPKFERNFVDTICQNMDELYLDIQPAGGNWYGTGVRNNVLDLSLVSGANMLTYEWKDGICSFKEDFNVFVAKEPVFSIGEYPLRICDNELIQFEDIQVQNGNWEFEFGNGNLQLDQDFSRFTYLPSSDEVSAGIASFRFTVAGVGECKDLTRNIAVKINPTPSVKLSRDMYTGCAPFKVTLDPVAVNSNVYLSDVNFSWDLGDPISRDFNYSRDQNPTHTYRYPGKYSISLTTTHNAGCSDTQNFKDIIEVFPTPKADFAMDPDGVVSILSPKVNFINLTQGGDQLIYEWNFGDGNYRNSESPTYFFDADTGYYPVQLTVLNEHGCESSITKSVYVAPDIQIYIPNAFTPDGEGPEETETFGVRGLNIEDVHVMIYNRWGEKVADYSGPNNSWDGTSNGVDALSGTYFYEIKVTSVTGRIYEYQGTINLIR